MALSAEIGGQIVESVDGGDTITNELLQSAYSIAVWRYQTQYFRSGWDRMKAAVEFLGGRMITPEPQFKDDPNLID